MIIRYPTALYKKVIPQSPEDRGNITYTISSTDPPQSVVNFTHIPVGVEFLKRSNPIFDRSRFGLLLRTNISSTNVNITSDKNKFDIGDDLEFTTVNPVRLTTIQKTNDVVHNTNYLDYAAMGLTDAEIAEIQASAETEFNRISEELNAIRTYRLNSDNNASEVQKEINEVTKTLKALGHLNNPGIVAKLNLKLTELNNKLNSYIAESQDYSDQYDKLSVKFREISQLIK